MNYLAHAAIAGPGDRDIVANLMGDFVRGRLEGRFAPHIEAGLRLHRAVDSFADAHPLHERARNRLEPPFRRYAGILVDVYFDHFLARHFEQLTGGELPAFTARIYAALDRHRDILPPRLATAARVWRRRDLLAGYADLAVIDEVFAGMSRRLKRRNPLPEGGGPLRDDYDGFEADFLAFYPALVAFARGRRVVIGRALGIKA